MICGNIVVESDFDFSLNCILCDSKYRLNKSPGNAEELDKFLKHVKKKHKAIVTSSENAKFAAQENDDTVDEKPLVADIKNEMQIEMMQEFMSCKYETDNLSIEVDMKDPILAVNAVLDEENDDTLDFDSDNDVKDEDYKPDEPCNDSDANNEEEEVSEEEGNNSNSEPVFTDKFNPTFFRKKRFLEEFIDLYKANPTLWDVNDSQFDDSYARKDAEHNIIIGMQKYNVYLEEKALRKALKKLHTDCAYVKYHLENPGQKKVLKVSQHYYNRCEFLKDMLEKQNIKPRIEDESKMPLKLNTWDENTVKFIEAYSTFPVLYDSKSPLSMDESEKEKAIEEFQKKLKDDHKIEFDTDDLNNAINQLKIWYFKTKNRKGKNKPKDVEEKYLTYCKFMPGDSPKLPFACASCPKRFSMDYNLQTHMFKEHKIGQLPFECPQCGKRYESKYNINLHIQRVHNNRSFACETCGKMFPVQAELKAHSSVHQEKTHVCELCGKAFRLKVQLGYHVTAIHTKIRAFKCTMCPKDFKKKRDLTDHIKTHLNIRDKICETCGKGFSNCHSLIRHRQIHSEVKRYECKLCDAKFHQFVGLNGHMKRTHNIVKKPI